MTDLSLYDVKYIERIVVGNNDPTHLKSEDEIKKDMDKLNDNLKRGGKIIGQEKSFNIYQIGEHQIVLQYLVYHVGFKRKLA